VSAAGSFSADLGVMGIDGAAGSGLSARCLLPTIQLGLGQDHNCDALIKASTDATAAQPSR
jgi:hypothetical protein